MEGKYLAVHVKRLDLGADVVYVPTRDVLVIHPDLDYAQALGAVMGTLPDLHPDVAVELVEQVTPRPHPEPVRAKVARGVFATAVAALIVLVVGLQPAAATARFGEVWQQQASAMGLECQEPDDDGVTVCLDDSRTVRVLGMRYKHADCYLIDRPGRTEDAEVLVFDSVRYAQQFEFHHPDSQRAGRVVIV